MANDEIKTKIDVSYLIILALITLAALASVSLYIALRPMSFLESGYPVWKAKQSMLVNCDLGQTVVFGDSQIDSAIIPNRLAGPSTNLGFAGGTPIETYFYAKQAAGCVARPKHVILSFGPAAFMHIQPWLWDNAVRYGLLGWGDLSEIRDAVATTGDLTYFAVKTHDGLNGTLRDILYASHFPSIYFNSLVEGRIFQRTEINSKKFSEVRIQRGYPTYSNGGGVAPATMVNKFEPLPLQLYYFERTLALFDKADIEVDFLITPMSTKRLAGGRPGILVKYMDYLQGLTVRYPRFHLLQKEVPLWPDANFGDGAHLNLNGAKEFSDQLKRCLETTNMASQQLDKADKCAFKLD